MGCVLETGVATGGREGGGGGGLAAEQIEQCIWQFAAGSREEEEAAEGLGSDIPYR